MREDIISHLRCPKCRSTELQLSSIEQDDKEITSGSLTCSACGAVYPIVDGVIELLPPLETATLRERETRDAKERDWEKERQRPYLNDNTDQPWIWPSFATNVEQGLEQVTLDGAHALDVGAATGWSTRMIVEGGAKAISLDISTGILRDGKAQFTNGLYFDRVAGTMDDLPFQDETFDLVFASAAVHHTGDLVQTFKELSRVLKPGGRLVLVNEPVLGRLKRASSFGQEEIERGMNEHIYRLSDYLNASQDAGLTAKVLFPRELELQLTGEIPLPPSLWLKLMKPVWTFIPSVLRRQALFPGHYMIGLTLILVAQK